MPTRRRDSGVTLIELVVTLAILGILVGITAVGISGVRPRAQLSTAVSEIAAIFSGAQQEAVARNAAVWVGWIPAGAGTPARVVVYRDWNLNFDPATVASPFSASALGAAAAADRETPPCLATTCRRDEVEQVLALPTRVVQAPSAGFVSDADVPGPFRWWASLAAAAPTGCSFCGAGYPGNAGWLEFLPDGSMRVSGTVLQPPGVALSLALQGGTSASAGLISLRTPFGLAESFLR